MKKAEREAYLLLNSLQGDIWKARVECDPCLCLWCRLAEWSGGCEDARLDCRHGIEIVAERHEDVWQGDDCWGFRPNVAREDAVDACGIMLTGHYVNWQTVPRKGRRNGA